MVKKFLSVLTALICVLALTSASFAELVLPKAAVVIDSEALAGCEDARILTIPNSDAVLAEDALDGSGIQTIRCNRDAAQIIDFAARHHIQVEYLDLNRSVIIGVSGSIADLTESQVAAFMRANPQYADATVSIIPMSESEAVDALRENGEQPDIFGFAQDQLMVLKNMGKLDPVVDAGPIRARNAAGSVSAAELGGKLYAYPMTADNGYFLYYDKSVVRDPSSMESILASCEAAGKKFYMQIDSGWYQVAYFFGAGCSLEFRVSDSGMLQGVDISYANANGVQAMKSLIKTIGSGAFVNGSSVDGAENWAAIVSGTWDGAAAKEYLGQNFAAAKLPTVDGYQMKSFGGFKMLGVTPQADSYKRTLCHALADWLTGEDCQLDRFREAGWGPSNMAAQQSEEVQGDPVLSALADQAAYAVPQGMIPGGYWSLASELIAEIMDGDYNQASDDTLMTRLIRFEEDIRALVQPTVVGISMPVERGRWAIDGNALKDGLEDRGIPVDLCYAGNDRETQQADIDRMIDEGVSVLIIAAINGSGLGTQMAGAKAAGIPVIAYDRLITNTDAVSCYTTFDSIGIGRVQGTYIKDALRLDSAAGPFNLEITAGDSRDGNARDFYQGAMEVLRPYIGSGKLIVKSGQTDFEDVTTEVWSTDTARDRAAGIIEDYYAGDTVHAWLCPNDSTALGVTQALSGTYQGTWPVITGQDCDLANVKNILQGKQSMSVFKDTRVLAARAATMAAQLIGGQEVEVNDTTRYNNGAKDIPSFLITPGYVDAGNYQVLIEAGYYSEEQLR